jgi:hypothetical protein
VNPGHRLLTPLAAVAVALLYLGGTSELTFVDPDTWHELALARQIVTTRAVPWADHLAFTPTVYPVVHHEWGTGLILYLACSQLGGFGLLLVRYLLAATLAGLCCACARRAGASAAVFLTLAPVVYIPLCLGITTLRAQVFTLVFLALLFLLLTLDRQGRRGWVLDWLPAHLIWLNLHAGFVVGGILFTAHTAEQAARRQPVRHLLLALPALAALVLLNPWGWHYYPYLVRALTLDRSLVTEWAPLWHQDAITVGSYAAALGLAAYAVRARGWGGVPGLLLLLACAFAGLRHFRHLSIFAVAWLCLVPAWLEPTALGRLVRDFWGKQPLFLAVFWLAVGAFGAVTAVQNEAWRVRVPVDRIPNYPVGPVTYLREVGFQGRLVTPFETGAFIAYQLGQDVRVSIDSRYEVAYPPGLLEEHLHFWAAAPGWPEFLERYRADAVLVREGLPVVAALEEEPGWRRLYRDDWYRVYVRAGNRWPAADYTGQVPMAEPDVLLLGAFPHSARGEGE